MLQIAKHLSAGVFNRHPVRCDLSEEHIFDPLFDIHIPTIVSSGLGNVRSHDLHGIAHRCMHDLCWFKPARAYILGLYVDSAMMNRLRTHHDNPVEGMAQVDCPKTFILFFSSRKDLKHIRKGFERSFENFLSESEKFGGPVNLTNANYAIGEFLAALGNRDSLKKGDRLEIVCLPSSGEIHVNLTGENHIVIPNASLLIQWIHFLYLGLESRPEARYKSMQQKLLSSGSV